MRKPILTAISILFAINAYAASWSGWNTNAWPSTNHYRWTNGNVTVDMVAEQRTLDDLFVINSGKAIFGASVGSLISGWNVSGYESVAVGPDAASAVRGTLYVPAYAAANSNYFNITNVVTYYRGIALGTNPPAANTNVSSYSWDAGNPFSDPVYYQTNTVTWTGVATQLYAQVKDLWGIDGYLALTDASEVGAPYLTAANRWNTNAVSAPIPYRNNRAALVNLKTWLTNNIAQFTDPDLDSDGITNLLETAGSLSWSATGLYAAVSAPTNWHEYTPWRDLGGNVAGQSAVVTNSYLCPTAGTYIVVDYWGGTNNSITATAAQETVTLLTTNSVILDGFTTADYGYRHLPQMLNKMTRTWDFDEDTEGYGAIVGSQASASGNVGSWAGVLTTFDSNVAGSTDSVTNYPTAVPGAGIKTTRDAGDTTGYIYAYANALARHCATGTVSVAHAPSGARTNMTTMFIKCDAFASTTYRDLLQIAPTADTWVLSSTSAWDSAQTKTIPTPPIPSDVSTGIPAPAEGTTNVWSQYITDRVYITDWQDSGLPYSILP